ncbi:mediator of RNA polymerase II transcription subunit 21-like [Mya arenaria]|uniref:mediator of RNA polymerase II transcription subunit 21-like n=1 Tax=Mya arenaria TaxID=6604 RepID=UPI0022E0CD3E|nr:mediator of RNA polymerase II transcription subunit 21-like [Mya arenaria]XP_052780084.1 mediator of RNA polymerase II transcription subunit 21-like [Mya arenaria]
MADRLTQLQDAVNHMGEHFCNSTGILQQFAPPSPFQTFDKQGRKSPVSPPSEDYAAMFSKLIARTAKDIDVLIDSLPSIESSQDLQLKSLHALEVENQESADRLEAIVKQGEDLLLKIQEAQHDIAQVQLQCQALMGNTT